MNIRVLGCSGSIAAGSRTTAFLLGDDVLIDAGSGVGDLTLDEMARIDHILISHSHLDHVLAIGLLADSVLRLRKAAGRANEVIVVGYGGNAAESWWNRNATTLSRLSKLKLRSS